MTNKEGLDPQTIEVLARLVLTAVKQGWFDKILNVFRKPHRVLVLGATGTGKTNMIDSFTQIMPEAIHYMARTRYPKSRSIKNMGEVFKVVDTPGDELYESIRMPEIRKAMARGLSGIINVVSFGYHEYRIGKREAIDSSGNVRVDFLERHRDVEKRALGEWVSLLGDREIAGWLITVVAKADLWWDRKEDVLRHYESGPYFDALGNARSLRPIVLPYCSVFHRFYDEGPLSGCFDDSDRTRLRTDLLCSLLQAVGKG